LAGIPSIVYGLWGLFVFGPLFADFIEQPLMNAAPPGSIWEKLTYGVPNGTGILAASIIVAMMVLPFIAATLRELLMTVPPQVRESAYGLGASTSEVVMKVTLPYVRRGAIGAVMLGLGRALGETMAVTFIIGNAHNFPKSVFDAGATIASTIANEFAEATSPIHTAALLASGFILFVITFVVLAMARMMIGQQRNA
jgi:phosphate transport system permease protein